MSWEHVKLVRATDTVEDVLVCPSCGSRWRNSGRYPKLGSYCPDCYPEALPRDYNLEDLRIDTRFEEMERILDVPFTYDRQRDITRPCIVCGKAGDGDEPNVLVAIGVRTSPNGVQEPLHRPVCVSCARVTSWGSRP